jgi:multidrug efflux pump subunit AcrB
VRARTTDQFAALQLRATDGHLVPLGRIATFALLPGQPEITRLDLQRVVSITARSDRDLGSTIRDVRAALDHPSALPSGVRYTLGGQYEEQQAAYRGTIRVVVAASALVLLLLLVLYERVRVAIAILITSMLAIAAVFVGLRITGTELNISSMMGMVMIVGNVTEVAIFYYSEYASLSGEGDRQKRLIAAGSQRLRAITMTTLAAILALLPLALDLGHSAGMLRPLAIAIITGLAVQLPLVLLLLPMLLTLFRLDHADRGGSRATSSH